MSEPMDCGKDCTDTTALAIQAKTTPTEFCRLPIAGESLRDAPLTLGPPVLLSTAHRDSSLDVMPLRQPRRSKRLVLSVPVHVLGQDVFRESFNEFTRTLSLSAHGGSLALAAQVETGQTILVVNKSTGKEQECRAIYRFMDFCDWIHTRNCILVGRRSPYSLGFVGLPGRIVAQ